MFKLNKDIKDIKRLEKIVAVFFEEGLGYYVKKLKLHSHLPFKKKISPTKEINDNQIQAVYLRKAFEKLGPTFIKFGQLLSQRPDLVPHEFSEEFEKLQDNVPTFPFSSVKKIIEEEFNKPFNKIFKKFEKKPIASASIAQTHKAVLNSGQTVAVKIQRPQIKKMIDADMDILFSIAQSLEKRFPKLKNYRPVDAVKEFAYWTRRELNFEVEAKNAEKLREVLKSNPQLKIPKIYPKYSTKKVLTMEFIDGKKIDDLNYLKKYKINKSKLIVVYFNSILEQSLLHGFFHADPHPANLFVQKNGKLVYLDYGIVGELTAEDRKQIINFVHSIPEKNVKKSLDIIISLADIQEENNLDEFKKFGFEILESVYSSTIEEKSFGRAIYELFSLGNRYGVVFSSNKMLIVKTIYQAEGLGLRLDPKFKVADGFVGFADKYLQQKFNPQKIVKKTKDLLWDNKDLLLEFPDHLRKIIEHLEKDEPPQKFNTKQIIELEKELEYLGRRRNLFFIAAVLVMASALLFYLEGRTHIMGFPLANVFMTMTMIILIYLVVFKKKR